MTEPIVLVDPDCLCGRPHPCELHGEWIGTPLAGTEELSPRQTLRYFGRDQHKREAG